MAKHLHTQVDIHADVCRVWQVLTDFAAYRSWNPFIIHVEGIVAAGKLIRPGPSR